MELDGDGLRMVLIQSPAKHAGGVQRDPPTVLPVPATGLGIILQARTRGDRHLREMFMDADCFQPSLPVFVDSATLEIRDAWTQPVLEPYSTWMRPFARTPSRLATV